jgi:hypothetical protein
VAVYFKNPPEAMALLYDINALSEVTGVEIDLSVLNRAAAFLRR